MMKINEPGDTMANYCSLTKEEFQITKNDIVLEDWNTIENVDMQNDEFISSKIFATQSS